MSTMVGTICAGALAQIAGSVTLGNATAGVVGNRADSLFVATISKLAAAFGRAPANDREMLIPAILAAYERSVAYHVETLVSQARDGRDMLLMKSLRAIDPLRLEEIDEVFAGTFIGSLGPVLQAEGQRSASEWQRATIVALVTDLNARFSRQIGAALPSHLAHLFEVASPNGRLSWIGAFRRELAQTISNDEAFQRLLVATKIEELLEITNLNVTASSNLSADTAIIKSDLNDANSKIDLINVNQEIQTRSLQNVEYLLASLTGVKGFEIVERALRSALMDLPSDDSHHVGLISLNLYGYELARELLGRVRTAKLLQQVGRRLADVGEMKAQIARLDGDEFTVVVPNARSEEEVISLCNKLRSAVNDTYQIDGVTSARLDASIGLAIAPADGLVVESLQRKADIALMKAHQRRWTTAEPCRYNPSMDSEHDAHVMLEADLRQALEANEFDLYYQPVVELPSKKVLGFEALIRWRHPERGFISPAEFVPLAEEIGLIPLMTRWIIGQATRDCADWPDPIWVAVNLSPMLLHETAKLGHILEDLSNADLSPSRLHVEVTESVLIRDNDLSIPLLQKLRKHGIRVTLDDFGTGYSSLGYLNRAVFDSIKIDGSFVRASGTRPEMRAILGAIRTLSQSFDMRLIAEGVENQADLDRMIELGCDAAQGYLFGRPVPSNLATALVLSDSEKSGPIVDPLQS